MVDPILQLKLKRVGTRATRLKRLSLLAAAWLLPALVGLALIIVRQRTGWTSPWLQPALVVLAALGGVTATLLTRRPSDLKTIARVVETAHPELDGRLLTAVRSEPSTPTPFSAYLNDRVLRELLTHDRVRSWSALVPPGRLRIAQAAHWLGLVLLALTIWQLHVPSQSMRSARLAYAPGVNVSPGDTSLEAGSSLVVLARFGGSPPSSVEMVVGSGDTAQRVPLVKSLADPMFGGSVADLRTNTVYHIAYNGKRTRDYKVSIYEHPRLEQSDADLVFPAYTGLEPSRVENTRRVTGVQGARLGLSLRLNKPVASAILISRDKGEVETLALASATNASAAFLKDFPLVVSRSYDLRLVDADGRTNKVPAQFTFNVLTNRTPELRLASPRGDLRPSPLEEIRFEGTVWDDFGVPTFGLGYMVAGEPTTWIELGTAVPAKDKRRFEHLLRLEDLNVRPDQLVCWFIWAEDVGPEGEPRRTTGDLFFGEVRPFDEIFREGQGMDGQQQQGGEQSGQEQQSPSRKLAELQKQIINATWRLQREQPVRGPEATNSGKKVKPEVRSSKIEDRSEFGLRIAKFEDRVQGSTEQALGRPDPLVPAARKGPHPNGSASYLPSSNLRNSAFGLFTSSFDLRTSDFIHGAPASTGSARPSRRTSDATPASSLPSDADVIRESQAEALNQAKAASARQSDPRSAALWRAAIQDMEKALARLKNTEPSSDAYTEALAAQQAAYQSLLKLQEHEYQVNRSRRQNQGGGSSSGDQMQRQLEQMEMTQSEDRYETQTQASRPQSSERREDLQVLSRLQELARRQQDLNERFKELQSALQEARTEQEREELRRRLKRLQEEEQQMLADVDELKQRMERPENQSRMSEQREQLERTREDIRRAAEAAQQGSAAQALASGTRAQSQLQEMRDDLRRENSSQFSEDLREMRNQARELARKQEELLTKLDRPEPGERKSLSASDQKADVLQQLARQNERLTNLVDRATQVSQDAEATEPLLSRQLHDSVRKLAQDTSREVQELQDQWLRRGVMTRSLMERLRDPAKNDGAKLLDATAEMLRLDFLTQAREASERARSGFDNFRQGVERAASSVLGDDTEALRLAGEELEELSDQLAREARESTGTNELASSALSAQEPGEQPGAAVQPGTSPLTQEQPSASQGGSELSGNTERDEEQPGSQLAQAGERNSSPRPDPSNSGQTQERNQPGRPSGNEGTEQAQAGQQPQAGGGETPSGSPRRDEGTDERAQGANQQAGSRSGARANSAAGGGNEGGDASGSLRRALDAVLERRPDTQAGPITSDNFAPWSDRLRDVEEMIEIPDLRNDVARVRERARQLRQDYTRERKKPDWAVVRLQLMQPLAEIRDKLREELARRESPEALVPIDRDPVPSQFSDLVRRYYENLGKDR